MKASGTIVQDRLRCGRLMVLLHRQHARRQGEGGHDDLPWMRGAEFSVCPEKARRHVSGSHSFLKERVPESFRVISPRQCPAWNYFVLYDKTDNDNARVYLELRRAFNGRTPAAGVFNAKSMQTSNLLCKPVNAARRDRSGYLRNFFDAVFCSDV